MIIDSSNPALHKIMTHHGILAAGTSELYKPYEMGRPNPKFHVLLFTLDGEATFFDQKNEFPLKAGDLLIAPMQVPHGYRVLVEPWKVCWIHLVKNNPLWDSVASMGVKLHKWSYALQLHESIQMLARDSYLQADLFTDDIVSGLLQVIRGFLERELTHIGTIGQNVVYYQLEKIWNFVKNDPGKKWTVDILAKEYNVSSIHFNRLVLKYFKKTPMEIVTRIRMDYAKILLRTTDYPLKIICERVGYLTPYAFSDVFKRTFGETPKEYRLHRSIQKCSES